MELTSSVLTVRQVTTLVMVQVIQINLITNNNGSLSTVVGDEKLTSRENLIGFLFLYVQSDENTLPKVNKVSKTEA